MPPDVGTAREGKERKPDKAVFESSDTESPGKIVCLFWESDHSPVENPQLHVLHLGRVLTAAPVVSRHLQLTEEEGQRDQEQMQVSVEVWYPRS